MYSVCPQCNSDAPEMYDCPVCYRYITNDGVSIDSRKVKIYPINEATKEAWFKDWQWWNGVW